jgi:hypothetical protein
MLEEKIKKENAKKLHDSGNSFFTQKSRLNVIQM